jgi:excisionase family DNA binding protein
MKPHHLQLDARENTASSRQHGSRLAVSSSQEFVRELERPHDKAETRAPGTQDVEVIDQPLADKTNEATGGRAEEAFQSVTVMVTSPAHNNTAVRSAVNHGESRQVPRVKTDFEFEPLLDVAEAAKLLRIHPKTLRVKAGRGIIPAVQIGRVWRFRASTLNRWLERIAR